MRERGDLESLEMHKLSHTIKYNMLFNEMSRDSLVLISTPEHSKLFFFIEADNNRQTLFNLWGQKGECMRDRERGRDKKGVWHVL